MVNKRVVETLQYIFCKLLQLIFRQVQCFHQLIEHYLVDILTNNRMLTSITHNVYARQVSYRRKNSVRAIQQRYFSFVIRCFRRNEQNIQTSLVSREFFGNLLRSFDNPKVEDFGLYYQIIIILQFFLNCCNILARESRNNTVNKRSVHTTCFFKPSLEFITQLPQFDILVDGFFQFVTVQEDKFAREDNQTFALITVECLETMIQ